MYKELFTKIKEYKNICIFRHVRPDGDAMFSSFALYYFIKENFKNKNIKICGNDEYDLLPYSYIPKPSFISKSLVIVLDTSNKERVDGFDFNRGDFIIKIDHHPPLDNYGDLNYINELASSTSELLADIFFSSNKFKISKIVATYLYSGILTDSNGFTTSNTTSNTLYLASKLSNTKDFDISSLNNYLFSKSFDDFKKISNFRSEIKVKDKVGYVICDKKLLNKLKLTKDEVKNAIDEFKYIKGVSIWAVFAYDAKTKLYDGSIRSASKYRINTICLKFNGGGHKNACGVKSLSLKQVNELIKELKKIV